MLEPQETQLHKPPSQRDLTVAVMITTHNRVDILRQTCEVLEALDPLPDEVLICADGCRDHTVELIQTHYPHYRLFIHQPGKGSVESRDRMMREAQSDLVLALDDDSYPLQSDIVQRLRSLFSQRPRLAIASFPQRTEEYPESLQQENFGEPFYCASFACSAACLRREVYLKVSGFDPNFFHAYEEPDYVLQCLVTGYATYFYPKVIIRHLFTPVNRNEIRTHHRHARNEQWSLWRQCPFPYVFFISLYRVFSQFRYACKRGVTWIIQEPIWWWAALKGMPRTLYKREVVPWSVYWFWVQLNSRPIYSDYEWEQKLSKFLSH